MRIAIVTCSPKNDYPRALSLRAAFAAVPNTETLIIRNRHTSRLRYPEVMLKILKARFWDRPDAYVLTFRGYEMMLYMRLTLVWRRPIIFDEFINHTEWLVEQHYLKADSLLYKMFRWWNGFVVRRCRFLLADTDAHAHNSAILNKLSIERYKVLPVCAEENMFTPAPVKNHSSKKFVVLYYGHMVALHGLEYVLQAATLLQDREDIEFRLIGGKKQGQVAMACAEAAKGGARVTHESWLPFEELPQAIHEAGLTLGGPFGDTMQAKFVITGKTYQVLACGEPVLIGKNKVNEGFHDRKNCLMVPQANAEALATAIRWAADHPAELKRIGSAGRELYERHFSQAAVNMVVKEMVAEL